MANIFNKLQKFRNDCGWRIESIPFGSPGKPSKSISFILSTLGLLAFGCLVTSVVMLFRTEDPHYMILFAFGGISAFLLHLSNERLRRADWIQITAKCIDKEIKMRRIMGSRGSVGNPVWDFRMLCEFVLDGQQYKVTPLYRKMFNSEKEVNEFLSNTIDDSGNCILRVNPRNPLEADFVGKKLKGIEETN